MNIVRSSKLTGLNMTNATFGTNNGFSAVRSCPKVPLACFSDRFQRYGRRGPSCPRVAKRNPGLELVNAFSVRFRCAFFPPGLRDATLG